MIKYIITWVLIKNVPVPCPQQELRYDQFGRIDPSSTMVYSMSCTERKVERHFKTFIDRNHAMLFYWDGLKANIDSLAIYEIAKPPTP